MTRSESPAPPIAHEEEPFYFVQRRSRSLGNYVLLLLLGAMIVGPPVIGIIKRVSPFGSQGVFYLVEMPLILFGALGFLVTFRRVLKNRVELLVVDRIGVGCRARFWTWDKLTWLGPSSSIAGGVWIAVKAKDNPRVSISLTLGCRLSFEQFEQLMLRVQAWASVHAPEVTIEATVPRRARKAALWRAALNFAIALGIPTLLFGLHAFARYRHPNALRLIIVAGALMGLYEGVRALRGR
jgi:hypothetical protein